MVIVGERLRAREGFYDWQTAGVDPSSHQDIEYPYGILGHRDCRHPHYTHKSEHQMFLDPKCVGEGSCIYNPDSQNDCVLWDWKCVRDKMPKWRSPPLDEDRFDFFKRYGFIPDTRGCLCDKY